MKTKNILLITLGIGILAFYCLAQEIDKDAYMKDDTPEYNSLTKKILGQLYQKALTRINSHSKLPQAMKFKE